MAIFQELSGQGRVVGGHLSNGTVLSGGTTPFSKSSDLSIQTPSNPFKRHKINAETVRHWEEIDAKRGFARVVGQAAATAALPGVVGRAVGAGLGAAMNSGHTVRLEWADGKQSIIELPEKQYMVLSVLLKDLQIINESPAKPEVDVPSAQPGVAEKIVDMASSVLSKRNQETSSVQSTPVEDVTEQITKLASLHAQGVLTDAEFSDKKAELLKRL